MNKIQKEALGTYGIYGNAIILEVTENYPSLVVYQGGNGFGDQFLTFVAETKDGRQFTALSITEQEGNHYSFDKKTMINLWDVFNKRGHTFIGL